MPFIWGGREGAWLPDKQLLKGKIAADEEKVAHEDEKKQQRNVDHLRRPPGPF